MCVGVCGCVGVTKIKVRARMSDAINDVARAQKGKWLGAESKHTQPKHPNTTLFVALCVCVHEFPPFPRANIQTSKHPNIQPSTHTQTSIRTPLLVVLCPLSFCGWLSQVPAIYFALVLPQPFFNPFHCSSSWLCLAHKIMSELKQAPLPRTA